MQRGLDLDDHTTDEGDVPTAVRPPIVLFVLALGCVLLSALLLLIESIPAYIAGWLCGTIFTFALVAAFSRVDSHAQRNPYYSPIGWLRPAWSVILPIGFVCASIQLWRFATVLAQ